MSQSHAYRNSPSTVGLILRIHRGDDTAYADIDFRDVTTVSVAVTFADKTTATWALTPDADETTETLLVAYKAWASGDTEVLGNATLVPTPYVGLTALPPGVPITMPIKNPPLS